MADELIRSGPFTSVNGDRGYKNDFFTDYFASFIGNGVFPNPSTNLQVVEGGGLNVVVSKGKAWVNGQIHLGDEDVSLALDSGDNLLNRIDKVVLRVDYVNRVITKEVKKGTPATNPVAPNLQRDNDIHELGLANIRVSVGATSITQGNITDLRLNSYECGIVKGTVEEMDTTTLFNQYQSWIAEKKAEYDADLVSYTADKKQEWDAWFNVTSTQLQNDFVTWFDGVKDIFDGDAVGNLINRIDAVPIFHSGVEEPTEIRSGDHWLKEVN